MLCTVFPYVIGLVQTGGTGGRLAGFGSRRRVVGKADSLWTPEEQLNVDGSPLQQLYCDEHVYLRFIVCYRHVIFVSVRRPFGRETAVIVDGSVSSSP